MVTFLTQLWLYKEVQCIYERGAGNSCAETEVESKYH